MVCTYRGGGAIEVASAGAAALVLVVGVEDVGELLAGVAHEVRAVDAAGGVSLDTGAGSLVLTADVAEDLAEVLLLQVLGGNARGGLLHALAQRGVGSRGQDLGNLPVVAKGGARSGLVLGSVLVHLDTLRLDLLHNLDELVVVLHGGGLAVLDLDETVVVLLLVEHVDDTTAEDAGHLVGVQGFGVIPETALSTTNGVAAVLSEENGDGVVAEEVDLDVKAGLLEAALAAPGVDVVTPVVDGLLLGAAVEVLGHVDADIGVVVGSIADTHPAVAVLHLVGDVLLRVTSGSLDERRGVRVGGIVGDLVTLLHTFG